jgi:Domain of unknown function (DUF4326)
MSAPQRIQLRRTKGWRKPEGAIVVARPTRWGNPWRISIEAPERYDHVKRWYRVRHVTEDRAIGAFVDPDTARSTATSQFRHDLENGRLPYSIEDVQRELAGHDLACWCLPTPLNRNGSVNWLGLRCHAEILIEWANLP